MDVAVGPMAPEALRAWYSTAQRDWVRASFITSLDGRATGPDGLSGGLNAGSAGDHAVFQELRSWADAVVVGAGTVRAEGYGPLPTCPLVVVTRRGEVPGRLRDRNDVLVVGGQGRDVLPQEVLDQAHEQGWRRIVLEGGPSLFGQWVAAGVVDELCVTVRPLLVGGDGPLLLPGGVGPPHLTGEATHVLEWDGDLLVRTRLGA